MDTFKEAWAIVLLVGVPTASFVGFMVHALTVRKSSLEIQKLRYEIEKLKSEQTNRARWIEPASFDQIMEFADPRVEGDIRYGEAAPPRRWLNFVLFLVVVAVGVVVGLILAYSTPKLPPIPR